MSIECEVLSTIFSDSIITKSLELLIFKCAFQPHEVIALQNHLPADEYCLINNPGDKMIYGVMNEELHSRFMDILSGETLECLEYLDEPEFRQLFQEYGTEVIGNRDLIGKL